MGKIEVVKRTKAHFRVTVKNVQTGKTATLSLKNHATMTEDDVRNEILYYFENRDQIKKDNHNKVASQNIKTKTNKE